MGQLKVFLLRATLLSIRHLTPLLIFLLEDHDNKVPILFPVLNLFFAKYQTNLRHVQKVTDFR